MITAGFLLCCFFFFFKQKTAYEMRISDWSSDVCSSDLHESRHQHTASGGVRRRPRLAARLAHDAAWHQRRSLHRSRIREARVRKTLEQSLAGDRKSVVKGKSVSVSGDHGGRRIIKKNTQI